MRSASVAIADDSSRSRRNRALNNATVPPMKNGIRHPHAWNCASVIKVLRAAGTPDPSTQPNIMAKAIQLPTNPREFSLASSTTSTPDAIYSPATEMPWMTRIRTSSTDAVTPI